MSKTRFSLTDPYPFVRLVVRNLAVKIPVATKIAVVAFVTVENWLPDSQSQSLAASFDFSKADLERLDEKSGFSVSGVIVDLLGRILVSDELVAGPAGSKDEKEKERFKFWCQ